jgi:hypothetical protein
LVTLDNPQKKKKRCCYLIDVHVGVSLLQRLGGLVHGLQDGRVRVGPLQRLPLLFDGRQRAVDLLQLTIVPLLALKSLRVTVTIFLKCIFHEN